MAHRVQLLPSSPWKFVRLLFALSCALFLPAGNHLLLADLLPYSSRMAFDAAAGPSGTTINFDSSPIGNFLSGSSVGGMTFTYNLGFVNLKVVNSLATTSGSNSLGTDDQDLLADGDVIDLSFAPRKGLGLYVISSDDLIDGDVRLTVGSTVASLVDLSPQVNLGGGRFAWFLGVQADDNTTFTSASLTTHGGGGAFNFNLDDFVSVTSVPEPSSLGLLVLAAISCFRCRTRRATFGSHH